MKLVSQVFRPRLNLTHVVMITGQSNKSVLVSPTEATHVRGGEAPVVSEQACDMSRSYDLDQYLHFHLNFRDLVCHLPKPQNFVSPAASISKATGPCTRPLNLSSKSSRVPFSSVRSSISWRPSSATSQPQHEWCNVGLEFSPIVFCPCGFGKRPSLYELVGGRSCRGHNSRPLGRFTVQMANA